MRYEHVCIEAVATLPQHVVTSDEIESRLATVYERLSLPAGRLELMTGIRERASLIRHCQARSASRRRAALEKSGIDRRHIGALIHGSVCRDQMEPATAASVHDGVQLPAEALVMDVSNACLGLLNGMLIIADQIELGRIRAGIVVGTESGRDLVEGTIDSLLTDRTLTRQNIKSAFASLTIGSGSAAIVLCDRKLSRTGHRLLGGAFLANSTGHRLCAGGVESAKHGDGRPRMKPTPKRCCMPASSSPNKHGAAEISAGLEQRRCHSRLYASGRQTAPNAVDGTTSAQPRTRLPHRGTSWQHGSRGNANGPVHGP
ncbi:MAG: hypothetical protein WKF77_23645 [Planctomycetaceae bacterium]